MATYKVVDADQLNADMTIVADSIRTKGGTTGALAWPYGYKTAVEAIQAGGGGGGGGSEEEWIGDGNTHIWIHLEEGRTSPMLGCCPNGTVTVDWGDGTTPDVLTGTSVTSLKWTPTHHYAAAGDYVITLTVDGTMGFYGSITSNQYSGILRYSSSGDVRNYCYRNAVQKIECGRSVTSIGNYAFRDCHRFANIKITDNATSIGNYAFYNCYSLASIMIPNGVASIGSNTFQTCYSLASITIPNSVTKIGSTTFQNCYSLASVTIPNSMTSIDGNLFRYCYGLANITIPNSVKSIGSGAFQDCYGLGRIRFESATPPTVANSNAFSGVPTDCVISVPVGSLAAYTSATNYPSSSTYTYIEED